MAVNGCKVVTLTVRDQNILRLALERAIEWERVNPLTPQEIEMTARIKDLKDRLS